jgi:uncharacterized protein YjiS (DUF1127 family)
MSHTATDLPAARFGAEAPPAGGCRSIESFPLRLICQGFVTLQEWRRRAAGRRVLAAMDDRMRMDAGLSDVDIWREINKPFWRA